MLRYRPISILLVALLFGQAILAGSSHSHCHHHATAIAEHSHSHADGYTHPSHDPEELPPIRVPTDEDDCTLCRHLAEASLLTIDVGLASAGQTAVLAIGTDDAPPFRNIVGLRRPRSPPQLG